MPLRFPTLLTLAFLLTASIAHAQQGYRSHREMSDRLRSLAGSSSGRATLRSIGTSAGGREIWLVTVGDASSDSRPAILVAGGVDASSPTGRELSLRMIEGLVADRSDSVARLLRSTTFYFLPDVNPDATEQFFASVRYPRDVNDNPTDEDRDGKADEDGYEDLNGDGMITQMRVRSPRGSRISDPEDSLSLRDADPVRGETGLYEIYSEGRDNDGDGRFNEDAEGGVSFNRNFTFAYPYFGAGAGVHQISEKETRAVADFCYDHPNIVAVFSFSPQNNLSHPWEARPSEATPAGRGGGRIIKSVRDADEAPMKRISELYGQITKMEEAPPSAKGEGAFAEWAYYHYGRFSFSTPGWWMPKPQPQKSESGDSTAESTTPPKPREGAGRGADAKKKGTAADTLRWLQANGATAPFVAWRKVSHPDFPGTDVEVGGFAPFVRSIPPVAMLDSIGTAHRRFLLFLGGLLPRLEHAPLRVENLGNGVRRVELDLVNRGYLPTLSEMGRVSRVPLDVKVEVVLAKGQTVASGRRVQLLGPVAGSGGVKKLVWIISGSGPVRIKVGGPMTGEVEIVE